MKKLYIENKIKIEHHRKKRFLYEQKRKELRKRNWKNRQYEKLSKEQELKKNIKNTGWVSNKYKDKRYQIDKIKNTETLECPSNYSFINNTEEFIAHLDNAKRIGKMGKCVDFNLELIENLTFDSLCLLLATTRDKEFFKNGVKGNFPKNPLIKDFIRKSGFLFDFHGEKQGGMFHYVSDKKLSLKLSKRIISTIQKHTFSGDKTNVQNAKIHPFMIEAMKNTDDHAGDGYNWRVFYQKGDGNITQVCFLDLGKGILNSIYSRIEKYFWDNPIDVLDKLFKGQIESPRKRTETKNERRGRGLPLIYNFLKGEHIQNAYAITNNVKFDISKGNFIRLNNNFHGTFYYREIKP